MSFLKLVLFSLVSLLALVASLAFLAESMEVTHVDLKKINSKCTWPDEAVRLTLVKGHYRVLCKSEHRQHTAVISE